MAVFESQYPREPEAYPNRAVWLSQQGNEIFSEWVSRLLTAASFDSTDSRDAFSRDVAYDWDNRRIAVPSLERAAGDYTQYLREVDEVHGCSQEVLVPCHRNIEEYTSANIYKNSRRTGPRHNHISKLALDSLKFGVDISVGFVSDTYGVVIFGLTKI